MMLGKDRSKGVGNGQGKLDSGRGRKTNKYRVFRKKEVVIMGLGVRG